MFKLWIINLSILGEFSNEDTTDLIFFSKEPTFLQKVLWWDIDLKHFPFILGG
jgi:hypothetical protein